MDIYIQLTAPDAVKVRYLEATKWRPVNRILQKDEIKLRRSDTFVTKHVFLEHKLIGAVPKSHLISGNVSNTFLPAIQFLSFLLPCLSLLSETP